MTRVGFLGSLLAAVGIDPVARLKRKVRARLVLASEEDNCGGTNDFADGYRQCGKDLLQWFDGGGAR